MGYPPIIKLKGEYTFYSLAKKKQRFPSIKARFCTEMLKIVPKMRWMQDNGLEDAILAMGIRREESMARTKRKEWERSKRIYGEQLIWNPLIEWGADEVFAIHKKYKVEPNPMYKMGFRRVGCFPCVNSGRLELKLLAKYYPWRIEEIARWEEELNSTYLAPRRKGRIWKIKEHILWAKRSSPDKTQIPFIP